MNKYSEQYRDVRKRGICRRCAGIAANRGNRGFQPAVRLCGDCRDVVFILTGADAEGLLLAQPE